MRSSDYVWKICMEIYQKMYEETEPPLDFKQAIADGITSEPNWFMNYYLNMKRQKEIFDEVIKKYRCDKYEKRAINMEIWLGAAPTGVKK